MCITPSGLFPPDSIVSLPCLFLQTPAGLGSKHTHVHTQRHTSKYTQAQTLPTATSRAMPTHPARGRYTQNPLRKGRTAPWCGQTHNCTHSHPEFSTQPDTPAHQPSPLAPAHARRFGSSFPTLVVMLRLKLCSSWKCKSCTR